MMECETVTFTKEVKIADADGKPIREGSVLREINDGTIGVVTKIVRVGDRVPIMSLCGDLHIKTGPGSLRVTNRYNQWCHVPRKDQTYFQRLEAWIIRPYERTFCPSESISDEEAIAVDGIMNMLPADPVDWENGPWPDRLEDALKFLVDHLEDLSSKKGGASC